MLRNDQRLLHRHLLALEGLKRCEPGVVLLLPLRPENPLPFGGHRGDEIVPPAAAPLRLHREGARHDARRRPGKNEPLAAMRTLEIVDAEGHAASLEVHRRRPRAPYAVDPVVFQDRAATEDQPRAVVGVEAEGVLAGGGHLQESGEHVAERCRPQRRCHADVEEVPGDGPGVLGLELVEVGERLPAVAVEAKLEFVEIAPLHAIAGELLVLGPEAGLDRRHLGLRRVAALREIGHGRVIGGLGRGIGKERPFDGIAAVAHRRHIHEERQQAVIVPLRDRVDLVIVAASAVDGQPEERLAGRGDEIVEPVVTRLEPVGRLVVPEAEAVVAGGDKIVGGRIGDLVAGKLLEREPIKRRVGVEGPDDIVAVAPSMRLVAVALEGVGLGIAHQIEPVPPPLLAVMGRSEEPVDDPLPRPRRPVGEKGLRVGLARRQTGEVVGSPPQERLLVGKHGSREPLLGEPFEHERVDGCRHDAVIRDGRGIDRRHRRPARRAKRPVFLPRRPLTDPIPQRRHLGRGEPCAFGGHLQVGIGGDDPLEHQARVGTSRHDRPPPGGKLAGCPVGGVEAQAPLLRVGAVAGEAAAGEERLDVAGKIDGVSGGRLAGRRRHQHRSQRDQRQSPRMSNRVNRHGTSCQSWSPHSTLHRWPRRDRFSRGGVSLRRRKPPPL